MSFFRSSLNLEDATGRPIAPADHGAITRLLVSVRRRFLAVPSEQLPRLLADGPGAVLASGGAIWGLAVAERTGSDAAWLRALVLHEGLPQDRGMDALLAAYHDALRAAGVCRSFYMGSEGGDIWLRAALATRGYARHTDVVVYEKLRLDAPTGGSQSVGVRRAEPSDLAALLELDHACFDDQWHKGQHAIAPALATSPCFLVAERPVGDRPRGVAVGYAFATSHYDGRLIHLVRIAVHPSARGQGVGARLLAEVVAYARGAGADTLTLNTQQDNEAARRLYERFGFRRTGERQTVMELSL
jgi:[ribosomal protein S18]-alanine N-acetyltransferase